MSSVIDLQVSASRDEEKKLLAEGFHSVPGPLVKQTQAPGTVTYLWYKRAALPGIKRIQISFTEEMADGLASAGYTRIDKNLNADALGGEIYLWYYKPTTSSSSLYDDRIMAFHVATCADDEPEMFRLGWERLSYDLNLMVGGKLGNLWFRGKSPTYISEINVCVNFEGDAQRFKSGWIRVDETTNVSSSGEKVFIWYRKTGDPEEAITDLKVSSEDIQHYEKVKQELCEGPCGKKIFLWYTKSNSFSPIQAVSVLSNRSAIPYEQAGNQIYPINPGSKFPKLLCYYR